MLLAVRAGAKTLCSTSSRSRLCAGVVSAASPGSQLTEVQRARVLPPAFWRDFAARLAEANGDNARCADGPARHLSEALVSPVERATLLASPLREAETAVAAAHGAFVDRILLDSVSRRLRQIILVGSGLDSRTCRLDLPPQLKVFEVDQPEVHEAKANIFASHNVRSRCAVRQIDAGPSFENGLGKGAEALAEVVDARKSSLFILDGELLAMWTAEARQSCFEKLRELAGDGSRMLVQVLGAGSGEASAEAKGEAVKAELHAAGWERMDVVGNKALGRLFQGNVPSDESGIIVVAEHGAPKVPGRPPVDRSASRVAPGQPREVKL